MGKHGKMKKKQIKNTKEKKDLISKDMTFHDIITKFPQTGEVFMQHNMFCAMGCPMAMEETLEQGAMAHGIDVGELLKELNNKIRNR